MAKGACVRNWKPDSWEFCHLWRGNFALQNMKYLKQIVGSLTFLLEEIVHIPGTINTFLSIPVKAIYHFACLFKLIRAVPYAAQN